MECPIPSGALLHFLFALFPTRTFLTVMATHGLRRRAALEPVAMVSLLLQSVMGAGALIGGSLMVLDPSGSLVGLSNDALDGGPFDSYLVLGLGLAALGIGGFVGS